MSKKRANGPTVSRLPDLSIESKSAENKVILDYVFAHAKGDKRPFLNVSIFSRTFLGLLDSRCTSTILGASGWNILHGLCSLNSTEIQTCSVANGQTCNSIGYVYLPICLQGRTKVIKVLVVPSIPHELILGIDFWTLMGIIPDLFSDEWSFRSVSNSVNCNIAAIHPMDSLTDAQRSTLSEVIDEAFEKMGDKLGCTDLVQLTIRTTSPPIKQRYYLLSPALQKEVNAELESMLSDDIIEPLNSPWSSPIVMIKKPDGHWRFCVDYRA